MSEWKNYKWGDLATLEYGKGLSDYLHEDGKYPVYGTNGRIGTTDKFLCPFPSIVVGRKGAYRGIHYSKTPFYVIDTAFYLNPKVPNLDMTFAYYQLLTVDINYMDSGSAIPSTSREEFYDLDIFLPPIKEQCAIASILSRLDDKIDLLQRQNKTLEQLAETLFRQWFVEEADESWEEVNVSDVCTTITKGTTPTTLGMNFTAIGVNFLKAESFTDDGDLLENKFAHINFETHEKLSRSKIQKDDLIITIAGTIGRVAIIPERVLPANTNQAVAILRPNKIIISASFLYCLFKSDLVINDFEGRVVHAVQPNLSLSEIGNISFKLPPAEKFKNEGMQLDILIQKKEKNNIQIRTLTHLRDTLLPKLMSGEIRVKY